MSPRTAPLEPFGVQVTGLSPATCTEVDVQRLQQLLAEHGVVVLPDQRDLDDAAFTAFLRRFGEVVFTEGETPVPGHPDLNVVTTVGRDRPPRSVFHVDTSYVDVPPAYTALRAVQVPSAGGETVFADQYHSYDTLDPVLREHLRGRLVRHVVTGVAPAGQQTSADHPVFLRHPLSGRTALYLSTPQRCVAVSGLPEAEAAQVIERLYEHCTGGPLLRHRWRAGDVVMWDNRCVLHRADHSGVQGERTLHRGMVAGTA